MSQNRHQNKYYSRQKGLSIILKGSIQSERSDASVCVSKNRFSRYMHENVTELKAETDKATTIVRDSTTTLELIDQFKQEIHKNCFHNIYLNILEIVDLKGFLRILKLEPIAVCLFICSESFLLT